MNNFVSKNKAAQLSRCITFLTFECNCKYIFNPLYCSIVIENMLLYYEWLVLFTVLVADGIHIVLHLLHTQIRLVLDIYLWHDYEKFKYDFICIG